MFSTFECFFFIICVLLAAHICLKAMMLNVSYSVSILDYKFSSINFNQVIVHLYKTV